VEQRYELIKNNLALGKIKATVVKRAGKKASKSVKPKKAAKSVKAKKAAKPAKAKKAAKAKKR
jgi:hypothetical protein